MMRRKSSSSGDNSRKSTSRVQASGPANPIDSEVAPTDHEVRAAVKAAQAQAAAKGTLLHSYQQLRDEPEVELEHALTLIHKCKHSADFDDQITAFQAFQRFVGRTTTAGNNRDCTMEKLVQDIQPKSLVMRFLVGVHQQRKMHRKRVRSTFESLLRYDHWQRALTADKDLCASLPPDLQLLAQNHSLLPMPRPAGNVLMHKFNEMVSARVHLRAQIDPGNSAALPSCTGVGIVTEQLPSHRRERRPASPVVAERCCRSPIKTLRQNAPDDNPHSNSSVCIRSNDSWYSRVGAFLVALKQGV
jgi:hypothetical protein